MNPQDFFGAGDNALVARWTRHSPGRKAGSSRCPGSRSPSRRARGARTRPAASRGAPSARTGTCASSWLHAALPPARALARRLAEVRRGRGLRHRALHRRRAPGRRQRARGRVARRRPRARPHICRRRRCAACATRTARDRVHRDAPDLTALAEALMAHELARVIADQARAAFALPWLKDAFANYALVAVLGETDPAALHRLGTLAEATRALASITPHASELGAPAQLVAVRGRAGAARADARGLRRLTRRSEAPRLRAGSTSRASRASEADGDTARVLSRDVHPASAPWPSHGAARSREPRNATLR